MVRSVRPSHSTRYTSIFQVRSCDTDFLMPKLSGIKFVEQLHALQPRLPINFITGYLSAASGATILAEVAAILAKPVEPDVVNCPSRHRCKLPTQTPAPLVACLFFPKPAMSPAMG